jgi:hypothetical protein
VRDGLGAMFEMMIEQLLAFEAGQPINVVDLRPL